MADNTPSGAGGTLLWTKQAAGITAIPILNGVVLVVIGTALFALLVAERLYSAGAAAAFIAGLAVPILLRPVPRFKRRATEIEPSWIWWRP
jgi:hypothetical protein